MSIDASRVIEDIGERVYDEVGEVTEDYLVSVKDEILKVLESKLNEVFLQWLSDYGHKPDFFKIVNVSKVDLTNAKRLIHYINLYNIFRE